MSTRINRRGFLGAMAGVGAALAVGSTYVAAIPAPDRAPRVQGRL